MNEELDRRVAGLENAVLALSNRVFQTFDEQRDEHGRWTAGGSDGATIPRVEDPGGKRTSTGLPTSGQARWSTTPGHHTEYDDKKVGDRVVVHDMRGGSQGRMPTSKPGVIEKAGYDSKGYPRIKVAYDDGTHSPAMNPDGSPQGGLQIVKNATTASAETQTFEEQRDSGGRWTAGESSEARDQRLTKGAAMRDAKKDVAGTLKAAGHVQGTAYRQFNTVFPGEKAGFHISSFSKSYGDKGAAGFSHEVRYMGSNPDAKEDKDYGRSVDNPVPHDEQVSKLGEYASALSSAGHDVQVHANQGDPYLKVK